MTIIKLFYIISIVFGIYFFLMTPVFATGDQTILNDELGNEATATNTLIVTVTTVPTAILDIISPEVISGERYFITVRCNGAKGFASGRTRIQLSKQSGTAAVEFAHNNPSLQWAANDTVANGVETVTLSGVMKVTVSGSLTLRLVGVSVGSDFSIASTAAEVHLIRFVKALTKEEPPIEEHLI